jgi:hypothetical protein
MAIKIKRKMPRATTAAKARNQAPIFPTVKTGSSKRDIFAKVKGRRTFRVKPPRMIAQAPAAKQLASAS